MNNERIEVSYINVDKDLYAPTVNANNLVYNTGSQYISGTKLFVGALGLGDGSNPSNNKLFLYDTGLSLGAGGYSTIKSFSRDDNTSTIFEFSDQQTEAIYIDIVGKRISGNNSSTINFAHNMSVSGTGIFNALDLNNIDNLNLSGVDIAITSGNVSLTNPVSAPNLVYNTGNQTISGIKTFATGIEILNSTNPQRIRVFNFTGTNTGEFGLFGWQNNQLIIGSQATNSGTLRDVLFSGRNININSTSGNVQIFSSSGNVNINPSGNININASGVLNIIDNTNINGNLTVTGETFVSGDLRVSGHLSAISKSFLIDHPLYEGKKLQYGNLEGPEHGVYVRGKTNQEIINLPNYWSALVDESSISVNLTPIETYQNLYVINYNNTKITVGGNNNKDYFYTIYGERKDIPKLTVEF